MKNSLNNTREKNLYYRAREASNLSREAAAELIGISATKLGRIERGEIIPQADDIVQMADVYNDKTIFNYYCSKDCKVGVCCRVDEVRPISLAEAALGVLHSVNAFNEWKDKFIEISMDGTVDSDELEDFRNICKSLKKISAMTERLKVSVESYKTAMAKKE